jgi:TonB family protein
MFNIDKSDIQRFAVSAVGAIALSATSLFAAAGPVKAATPLTVADWQSAVAQKVEAVREPINTASPSKLTKAQVAVHFTADGDYAGATLARSSGNKAVDARALKVAAQVAYPALPAELRGTAQTVAINLYFGEIDQQMQYLALQQRKAKTQFATAYRADTQLAAK